MTKMNYKIFNEDLYKNGIFTDDEQEIANNIYRKVNPKQEIGLIFWIIKQKCMKI